MSIIDRIPASVQTDPGIHDDGLDHFEPTVEDWAEVAAWRAATEDPGHFDGPVPLEVLDASVELAGPRYEVRIAGSPDEPAHGYHVWDVVADCKVSWHRWFTDASNDAEDLNAEDWAPVVDGAGRPWYEVAPPSEIFDGPRVRLV